MGVSSLPHASWQRCECGNKYSQRRVENIRDDVDEQENGRNCRDSLVNIFSMERSSQESCGFSHERFNGRDLRRNRECMIFVGNMTCRLWKSILINTSKHTFVPMGPHSTLTECSSTAREGFISKTYQLVVWLLYCHKGSTPSFLAIWLLFKKGREFLSRGSHVMRSLF